MIVKAKVMVVVQRGYYTVSLNSIGIEKIKYVPIPKFVEIISLPLTTTNAETILI